MNHTASFTVMESGLSGVSIDAISLCAEAAIPLRLDTLNPRVKAIFASRLQAKLGAGFEDGVNHAVCITPAAGQQEAAAAAGRFFQV
jgi:hypothetical protein